MNRKKIIILAIIVFFIVFASILFLYKQKSSAEAYSKKFKQVVIDNEWAEQIDFDACRKAPKNCIVISGMYIKNGLLSRADYTNYNLTSLDASFSEINLLINEEKYKQALQKSEEIIKKVNINYGKYVETNQQNFNDIDGLMGQLPNITFDFNDINYRIIDNWAVVTLLPKTREGIVNVVLQKYNNETWAILIGPGTFFDDEALNKYPSMPPKIKAGANTFDSLVIVHNPEHKKPADLIDPNALTKQVTIDPLSEYLPYLTNKFTVNSSLLNGLPIYTVSYYDIAGNTPESIKTSFRAWLTEINVSINESFVRYETLQMPDYSGHSES